MTSSSPPKRAVATGNRLEGCWGVPWWACQESPPPGAVAAVATGDPDFELLIFSVRLVTRICSPGNPVDRSNF